MIMPSCSVSSTQSPWHQTSGKRSKYAARYLRAVGVVPEADRHRRERRRADELALLAARAAAPCSSNTSTVHAEAAALQLAAPHRQRRACRARSTTRCRCRRRSTTGSTSRLHALVDVVEALGRERRAGREHRRAAPPRSRVLARHQRRSSCSASMYLADVPKCVMRSASAKSNRTRPRSMNGEPS